MKAADRPAARRMVVKIGTSLLRQSGPGLNRRMMRSLAKQIAEVRRAGCEVVVVSSGAVGGGMMTLRLSRRPTDTATLQAAAAIGQPRLMQAWAAAFSAQDLQVAQVLLTNEGLRERWRFLNAKKAISKILDLGVVPIVNENDTVAVEELTFGDNDKLSALVSAMVDAELLVNLTDVDGFYATSGTGKRELMKVVTDIRPEWLAPEPARGLTLGGMTAKLKAAEIALQSGIPVVIAGGRTPRVLARLLCGADVGTRFVPKGSALKGKKKWLSFFPVPAGQIVVDPGAVHAVTQNCRSLLPSGILRAVGHFPRQSCVSVVTEEGREIARGVSFYSSAEIGLIAGGPSSGIRHKLGLPETASAPPEVIHRDSLVATVGHGGQE